MGRARRWPWQLMFAVPLAGALSGPGWSYTPDSPVVEAMVQRAARYLGEETNRSLGHLALAAMALLKAGEGPDHPLIHQAIAECKSTCTSPESVENTLDIYATSVVGLFLSDLDPSLYQKEISVIIRSLEIRQKTFGGWGYPKQSPHWETGDTSMTQYAVLCSWVSRNSGAASISQESVRKVCNWLMRTQDVSGAWGYQGDDPGVGIFERKKQEQVRHSLGVAGLGSMYICANMLGFTTGGDIVTYDQQLPRALKPVVRRRDGQAPQPDTIVDVNLVRRSMRDGDRWYQQNYRINPVQYTMYYLYTLERYQSFRELAEGRSAAEPKWYNDGVTFLRSQQDRDGWWDLPEGAGRMPDTAFAVLFLKRSAKKTIQKISDELDGLLTAGRGLPTNTKDVRLGPRGNIVRTPFQGTADALLEILEDADHPDLDAAAEAMEIQLSSDPRGRAQQLLRMRRLVRSETFTVRLTAVKTMASTRELDNVPALVYALSDPDLRVVRAARDGLRFVSRKFGGFGLSDQPSQQERDAAILAWKKWYLAIRPEALFPR